ncbi:Cro/CI family transcriptional regulator [Acinetobacter baumannii]|uniref:Cro/CI family transcriptional regulator n=1 Tax=Acinetobacter calcoaceticus/baumannii complex TaxID=909768 RepID=UPI002342541E|nr:Cro/CI family transcriptional regulator [Acinetobacter baumannii]MDC4278667.1 Cro/CI family transcriptional regulator [Acinetobacter baumannii]MDC4624452.1 Cro/CI family transcriptional regulator [Acinetobacter baumannii]MDH2626610.1 Cro/CI family transcriptional regulator [Acinetobacter baumannii]MDR9705302.1 Cro/CI family transcriptional regulator [Acinetobacter baumannii]MEC6741636.1 Cro/CI family transcriptional regulator [Acinetobacter baumannii]
MTKTEALALLDCGVTELAYKLSISTQAISQWPEEKIPLAREYQIRDLAEGKEPLKNKVAVG